MRNAILLMVLLAGCGQAAISSELRTARATMGEARVGNAARFEPDQLRAAERTLDRAEAAPDGSAVERDLAYVADRQARVAIADARRISTEQMLEEQERQYQTQLENTARDREEQLEGAQADLSDAERRADEAMHRLEELVSVREEENRMIITIAGEVLFETNRADLRPNARDRLQVVAEALRQREGSQITVEGHTDSRGSVDDNSTLSQQRAEAVRQFLLAEGVPADRLRAIGRGEDEPIADNHTPDGRAENRRVEIEISPPDARVVSMR